MSIAQYEYLNTVGQTFGAKVHVRAALLVSMTFMTITSVDVANGRKPKRKSPSCTLYLY
jgi:hypothetical protein